MDTILLPPLGELKVSMPTSFSARNDVVAAYSVAMNQRNHPHLVRVAFAAVGLCADPEHKLPRYSLADPNILAYGGAVMDALMAKGVAGVTALLLLDDLVGDIAESLPSAEGIQDAEDFTSAPSADR